MNEESRTMQRFQFYLLVGVLITSALRRGPSEIMAADDRPNIIFVITDDQRWDQLGCTGHPVLKTPHIDRIGREGASFNNFFVATPLCSPSRASFLTGLYPHRHRVINNDKLGIDVISHTLVTFPRQLREQGYETAFVGKWHMGLDDSRRPGFDSWISFKGQGIYIDGVVNDNGTRRQLRGNMTDYLNRRALEFVKQPHDKPFCLYLGHKAVHAPFLPTERHDKLYSDFEFQLPPRDEGDLAGKPILTRKLPRLDKLELEGIGPEPGEPRRGRGNDAPSVVRDQLRCLASVDEGVGQLFAALESTGQLDNTIFIYTSDNGFLMGEHGRFNAKRFAYDEALRVPFLIRYPKLITPGSVRKELVLNIDVAPTLLELAGVESIIPMHGKSLVPLLRDADAPWREAFLAEYFLEKVAPRTSTWQAVRTHDWKYIHYLESDSLDELYHLEADPKELKNLVNHPAHQTRLEEMRAQLQELAKQSK